MITKAIVIAYIHCLQPNFWTTGIETGLEKELKNSNITVTKSVSFHLPDNKKSLIIKKISDLKPSMIVLSNDLKLEDKNLLGELRKINIPIFFAGKKAKLGKEEGRKCTGVYGGFQARKAIQIAEKLKNNKGLKKIGIINTSNKLLQLLTKRIEDELGDTHSITTITIKNLTEWRLACRKLAKETDIFVPLLPFGAVKTNNKPVTPEDWPLFGKVLKEENKNTLTLGVGTLTDFFPRSFGFMFKPQDIGKQLASIVYAFLKGKKIEEIPPQEPVFADIQLDMREIKRIGLTVPEEFYSFATTIDKK